MLDNGYNTIFFLKVAYERRSLRAWRTFSSIFFRSSARMTQFIKKLELKLG